MNDTSKKPFSKDIILLDNVEEVVENITARCAKIPFSDYIAWEVLLV
jgi:hypothetical protein